MYNIEGMVMVNDREYVEDVKAWLHYLEIISPRRLEYAEYEKKW
jgi:hypothetical protein